MTNGIACPRAVEEKRDVKLLWDFNIKQIETFITSDLILHVIQKKKAQGKTVLYRKEQKSMRSIKVSGKRKIEKLWKSKTTVVPVVVGALSSASEKLTSNLERLGIPDRRTMLKYFLLVSPVVCGSLR